MDLGYQSDSTDSTIDEPIEYEFPGQSFDSLKELGNQLFKQTFQDNALSMAQYQQQMCQALQYYNRACNYARNAKQLSSIKKNIAVSQLYIVQRMAQCNPQNSLQMTKEFRFFVEDSLANFEKAIEKGKQVQGPTWMLQLKENQRICAELMWNFLISLCSKKALCVLLGQLHQFCWSINEPTLRANLFLKLGRFTFQKAVELQENKKYIESLQLLHDNRLNIEEAKRISSQLEEATELEESTYIHLCIGEAAKARHRGDCLWKEATCHEEEIQMELTWDAVDCYLQSIVLSRSKCLESEAMAHSQLGRLYELIVLNEKSREHYKLTIQLAMAMHPKICKDYYWYKQAFNGLDRFQQKQTWDEKKQKEAIRAPIRIELKQALDELKLASQKSAQELLNLIYDKHPPKRGTKSTEPLIRSRYKTALLHYHPDKQDLEEHGLKWIVMSEEITVLLTYHFERMKSDPELENVAEKDESSESEDSSRCEDDDWETVSWETVDSSTDSSECYYDAQETDCTDDTTSESGDSSDSEDADDSQDFILSKKLAEELEDFVKCDCAQRPLEQIDTDSIDAQKDEASADSLHWKQSGFSGSFFSIKCRSIRIGSYRFTPTDRVLFSEEGFMIQAPVFNPQEPSKTEYISLNLPIQELLQVEAHFTQELLVIFLDYAPTLCSRVSADLSLPKNGDCWNASSRDESQKRLTLFPCSLDDSVKKAVKETFDCKGIFREISTSEAHRALILSSLGQD